MRFAECGDDLRHLEAEHPVRVSERRPMTMRISLVPFGRVRPDLDALPRKRGSVAGAAHGARHPEAAAADPLHDRRIREGSRWHRPASRQSVRGLALGRATGGRKPQSLRQSHQRRGDYGG